MKDRIALVGLTAAGFADDYWVPSSVSRKMSGVEVHANAIETILRPAFFRTAGGLEMGIVIIGFAVISGFALPSANSPSRGYCIRFRSTVPNSLLYLV